MTPTTFDKRALTRLRRAVWSHYRAHGRHDLPWRKTTDPYKILVSEVMLQQTQVARVIPKYRAFLERFPTVRVLARAPLRDVLIAWQGLGYNRRAKMLHEAAQRVVDVHGGRMPHTYTELIALPGIGPYTAGAVCAFAYNEPVGMVETNIRTVLFHHLLGMRHAVPDAELLQLTVVLCDRERPREWYWALMDYGAHLKEQGVRVNHQSRHYTKQSKFEGSDRQIRGNILRQLAQHGQMTERALIQKTKAAPERVHAQLQRLSDERLIRPEGGRAWSLY